MNNITEENENQKMDTETLEKEEMTPEKEIATPEKEEVIAEQEEITSYFLENYDVSQGVFESAYFDFISILNQFNLIER